MPKTIVIIGGSYAAFRAIGSLFKFIDKSGEPDQYKVVLVSGSSHFFMNVASPMLLVEPHLKEKAFYDVDAALKKKAKGKNAAFIHGTAVLSHFKQQTVDIKLTNGDIQILKYDYLVIATGARTANPAFKLYIDHEESIKSLEALTEDILRSDSIAILGGGITGVEVAGELSNEYPHKNITLFTGSSGPLSGVGQKAAEKANAQLKRLGVKVVNEIKYSDIEEESNGKKVISFDDGTKERFDSYVLTNGIVPNSEFIDHEYLDKQKYVVTGSDLIVKGTENVFAIGDIVSGSKKTIVDLKFGHVKALRSTVGNVIFNTGSKGNYTGSPRVIVVPISRKRGGVGYLFGIPTPNWFIRKLKRDFMLSKAADEL